MQDFATDPRSHSQDFTMHKQVKGIADLLRPELLRLDKGSDGDCGNRQLYVSFVQEVKSIRKEVTNSDALFTFRSILNHMSKVIVLTDNKACHQEVLWHLQEVMSLLFRLQNLPS